MNRTFHEVVASTAANLSPAPSRTLTHPQSVPRRPRQIQQTKPSPIPRPHRILPRQDPRSPIIPPNPSTRKQMRRIRQSSEFPPHQTVILLRLLTLPNSLFPLRVISIVMILMHRPHHPRSIHDRNP